MADYSSTYLGSGELSLFVQSPADALYIVPSSVIVSESVLYYQRVYSTGLNQWCYYSTVNALNPNPDPAITSPSWTGSINSSQVIAAVPISQ